MVMILCIFSPSLDMGDQNPISVNRDGYLKMRGSAFQMLIRRYRVLFGVAFKQDHLLPSCFGSD